MKFDILSFLIMMALIFIFVHNMNGSYTPYEPSYYDKHSSCYSAPNELYRVWVNNEFIPMTVKDAEKAGFVQCKGSFYGDYTRIPDVYGKHNLEYGMLLCKDFYPKEMLINGLCERCREFISDGKK